MSDFHPPLREPVSAPTPQTGTDFDTTEHLVAEGFFRSIPPMQWLAGRISGGEYVLTVQYLAHRQQVRGRDLIHALAQAKRLYNELHVQTTQEAA